MRALYLLLFAAAFSAANAQDTFVYISDAGNFNNPPWQILIHDMEEDTTGVFIDEHLAWPQDIVFLDEQGNDWVLISNLNTGLINIHNATSGDYIGSFAVGLGGPTRMKIGDDGLLYVLQWSGNGLVKRFELDGTHVDDFTDTAVLQSIGMDWDDDGNLYVSSYTQDKIYRFDTAGNLIDTFIDSALVGPTNIWFDHRGHLFVHDYDGATIREFDEEGDFIANHVTGLSNPEGIAYFPDSSFIVGNGGTGSVRHYNKDAVFLGDLVASNEGGLIRPNAVVIREVEEETNSIEDIRAPRSLLKSNIGCTFQLRDDVYETIHGVEVIDINGNLIASSYQASRTVWDARDATPGMYIIQLASDDALRVERVAVVK